jgi:hypothetical protein
VTEIDGARRGAQAAEHLIDVGGERQRAPEIAPRTGGDEAELRPWHGLASLPEERLSHFVECAIAPHGGYDTRATARRRPGQLARVTWPMAVFPLEAETGLLEGSTQRVAHGGSFARPSARIDNDENLHEMCALAPCSSVG